MPFRRLPDDKIGEIKRLAHETNLSFEAIAAQVNVSPQSAIKYGLRERSDRETTRIERQQEATRANDQSVMAQEPPEEQVLRQYFMHAGSPIRYENVIESFFQQPDQDNLIYLDQLMMQMGMNPPVRMAILNNWADHRGIAKEWLGKQYPSPRSPLIPPSESEQITPVSMKKDAIDDMIETTAKQLKLKQMMKMLRDIDNEGKTVEPLSREEAKLRILEDGNVVKMTDQEWKEYLVAQLQLRQQREFVGMRKELESQIEKWILLNKSSSSETKKDVYELIQQLEKQRHETERSYQQQIQVLENEQAKMILERQEQMIHQLQQQIATRPNPIQEMVQTQSELKQAGLLAEGSKDIEQHQMAIQEKKLDTTMSLILQQQAAINQKTNQFLNVVGPILLQYAQKAAERLPEPGKLRADFRERRKQVAQEVMPLSEQELQAMQQRLESELQEDTSAPSAPPPEAVALPKPITKKTLAIGRQEAT